MILGIALTVLNLVLNIIFIRGLGPIPALGTKGAAVGTCIASGHADDLLARGSSGVARGS